MGSTIAFMIILQVVLILLNAVFACAEIAIISVNDNKLAKMAAGGNKRAARLVQLTSQPARFLATIQVAITLAGFMGSAFAAENFSDILVGWITGLGVQIPESTLHTIAVIVITVILSYFTLVFGELVPKRVAMRKAEPLALAMSALISGISKIFAPVVWLLTASTNGILRLMRIDPDAEDDEASEEEIRMMVDVGSEKGTIDHEEKEFIQNVFEFDDLYAEEVATHRTDVILLDTDDDMEEWDNTIINNKYSLYPVCSGSADNIIGILDTSKYFRLKDRSRENIMENAVMAPYFVPSTVKADVLFRNMKEKRNRIAVVLDEYGGMDGIITINDLVGELVGDIYDEPEEPYIDVVDEKTWKIRGGADIDDVSEASGITFPDDGYDTFNGFIISRLGIIPTGGEELTVEELGVFVKVLNVKENQVESAIMHLL